MKDTDKEIKESQMKLSEMMKELVVNDEETSKTINDFISLLEL